ncbi:MAG: hypothetical protein HUJ92_01225 [Bacteroidales bacterium]|nr:hypothetical protein [Bacteroidales bacterium]
MRSLLCWILILPLFALSLLPLRVHHIISNCLAWFLRCVAKYRNSIVYTNLSRSFPDISYKDIDTIAKAYYRSMTDILCEAVWSMTRSYEHLRRKEVVTVENADIIADMYSKHGTVIVFQSHMGNWEIYGGLTHYCDREMPFDEGRATVAYTPLHSKTSEILFRRVRVLHQKGEHCLIPSNKMLRFVISNKDNPWVYFFNSDQCPVGKAAYENTFLNQPTGWVNGGEVIARKLSAPVIYSCMDRIARGRYVIRLSLITENAAETTPGWIMEQYTSRLEQDIINNKSNWLWSHRRWKNIGVATA